MFTDTPPLFNRCHECNLNFDTAHELQNHKRRFCINSGYDNLDGLAKIEFQGGSPPHKPKFSNKNHLQQYGSHSLSQFNEHNHLTEDNLNNDMKNINRFKRQIEKVHKYKHTEPSQSQFSTSKPHFTESKMTNNSYSESRLDEQLKRYEKPLKEEAVSPPTFIDQLNMRNYTMLDKSNSTMAKMPNSDKIEYAKIKLDELNEIKLQYIQNGGKKAEFKDNVEKMIVFYQKFLRQQEDQLQKLDSDRFDKVALESRCSTPILKLRNLDQSAAKMSQVSSVSSKIKRKEEKKRDQPQNFPQWPGQPYGYPPFMMPYPQPPQNQSDGSMRVLEKMMELKSEENKQLMEILLMDRKNPNQPAPTYQATESRLAEPQRKKKKGQIDVEDDYQFKKSMIDDLISQEKVLLALQQEQLDELKLLSQLPKDLQEIKMQGVIKSSDTRFQVQKELLKQKMNRLAFQENNQTFEEERKLNNDRWAGEQRKKLLEEQVDRYLDNFEGNFTNIES